MYQISYNFILNLTQNNETVKNSILKLDFCGRGEVQYQKDHKAQKDQNKTFVKFGIKNIRISKESN